tara:strand:- start:59 stop:949 length:891 start_codon:yes stop_codon:yes gene_type:complete
VIKPKNKLEALTINESLGDIPTHFMKSGSSYRPISDLEGLAEFRKRIIPEKHRGSPFEYDIWFNTNAISTIQKWLYTDFLGNGIYIRVPSIVINNRLFKSIVASDIKIDEKRCNKIVNNFHNKYTLGTNLEYYDKVAFLPGTNILAKGKTLHWGRLRHCVEQGFKIKPHPITQKVWIAKLKEDFGEDTVLDKKLGGFELLANCKQCATMQNSEMGLMALMLDKDLSLISHRREDREKNLWTYESIYETIANTNAKKSLMKIFSAKNSGIIFSFDKDGEERLNNYLNNFWEYKVIDG